MPDAPGDFLIAFLIFAALAGASLGSRALYDRIPKRHRAAQTEDLVRLFASLFVVMASLVVGLMLNTAKNTYESVDTNVHAYATEIILLDRTLKRYGAADTADARRHLLAYVGEAAQRMTRGEPVLANRNAETLLDGIGHAIRTLKPADDEGLKVKDRLEHRFDKIFEMHWALVEQSEGSVPPAFMVIVAAWLILIFASYGYRAPHNPIVVGSFLVSSMLVAAAIYLVLDMDVPFEGLIRVSPQPLERAIVEIMRP